MVAWGAKLTLGSVHVCTSKYRVYCATCQANDQGLLNPKPTKLFLIHDGIKNWKKALKKFHRHERSNMDKEATQKLAAKARGFGINAQLNAQLCDNQKHHRSMFTKLLQFLSRQGLPFRGHEEDVVFFNGNLYQLTTTSGPEMISLLNSKEQISQKLLMKLSK